MQDALGIQTTAGVPGNPGVVVENGKLVVRGNAGDPNALSIQSSDLTSSNAAHGVPLQFTQTGDATGGGVFTAYTIYDSLGAPVTVNATFTLDSTPDTGPVWRYYLETAEPGNSPRALGTGTASRGRLGKKVAVDRPLHPTRRTRRTRRRSPASLLDIRPSIPVRRTHVATPVPHAEATPATLQT